MVKKQITGSPWRLKVNELYELLIELVKIGMPAEDIADRLDLECESVIISMAPSWQV